MLGDFHSSLSSKEKALEIRRNLFGEDVAVTADSYISVGVIHLRLRNYSLAIHSLQRGLEIRLKVCGKVHLDTAESYFLLRKNTKRVR